MRIIGGQFKGRRFSPPAKNWPTRPTTDFAKESLFNILYNNLNFEDLKVLDLFGGSGNISYEFISRGCTDVTFVDKFRGCVHFARKVAKDLDIQKEISIIQSDVFKFIKRNTDSFDLIFADPPYDLPTLPTIPDAILSHPSILNTKGWLILEHGNNHDFKDHPQCFRVQKYGQSVFSFFEKAE